MTSSITPQHTDDVAARIDALLDTLGPADVGAVISALQNKFGVMAAAFSPEDVTALTQRRVEEMDLAEDMTPGMSEKIAQGLSAKKNLRDHISESMKTSAEDLLIDTVDDAIMSFTGGSITARMEMHTGDVYSISKFSDGEHAVEFAQQVKGRTIPDFQHLIETWQSEGWDGPVSGDDVPDMRVVDVKLVIRGFEPVTVRQI